MTTTSTICHAVRSARESKLFVVVALQSDNILSGGLIERCSQNIDGTFERVGTINH